MLRFDRAMYPFIAVSLALALAVSFVSPWWSAPFLILTAFLLFFFRDPERVAAAGADTVVSPADGRVLVAGAADVAAAPPGEWLQVSIFLSPMDVHVNRIPASGRVTTVTFTPGRFLPAYRHDAGTTNERSEVWIGHGGQMVVARQIVGMLARRVVCRVTPGTEVHAGDRFGIMKFGSRMDVFLPLKATIAVKAGDMVRGGETVIAVLH
jgi:phosphatidylserine decarboxylase